LRNLPTAVLLPEQAPRTILRSESRQHRSAARLQVSSCAPKDTPFPCPHPKAWRRIAAPEGRLPRFQLRPKAMKAVGTNVTRKPRSSGKQHHKPPHAVSRPRRSESANPMVDSTDVPSTSRAPPKRSPLSRTRDDSTALQRFLVPCPPHAASRVRWGHIHASCSRQRSLPKNQSSR